MITIGRTPPVRRLTKVCTRSPSNGSGVPNTREESWVLHEQMVHAAREAIHKFQKHPRRATLKELARVFDLASVMGRRACGLPLEPAPVKEEETTAPVRADFEELLRRAYGPTG